jgi:hypothetical protein
MDGKPCDGVKMGNYLTVAQRRAAANGCNSGANGSCAILNHEADACAPLPTRAPQGRQRERNSLFFNDN